MCHYYIVERYGNPAGRKRKVCEVRLGFLPFVMLAVPLAEIATFVVVGSQIGVLATIALVLLTAITGAFLLRIQGLGALERIRTEMERGNTPGRDLVHGVMIMAAGLLLLVPGFLTDTLGLLLFVPPVRDAVWRFLRTRVVVTGVRTASGGHRPRGGPRDGRTIDLDEDDYSREDQDGHPRGDEAPDNRRRLH